MLLPLIEFGGFAFLLWFAFLGVLEIAMLHKGEEASAVSLFVGAVIAFFLFVYGAPAITWHWLVAYAAGAFAWVPIYWYLTLRGNRRQLMLTTNEFDRRNFGFQKGGKWLPSHPEYSELVANGLLWFLAAPVHCAKDWINWVVDMFSGLMDKIQMSMAVDVPGERGDL